MDSNKFYCRNAAQSATASTATASTSTSSISSSATSSAALGCGGNHVQDYMGCGSTHSATAAAAAAAAGYSCKELPPKSSQSKSLLNHRGTNITSDYANVTGAGVGSSSTTSGYCSSSNSSGTGNYINVMPVSMGTLQYHRRKLTPQEYHSRLYYNTTDYRGRDDYYNAMGVGGGGGGVANTGARLNTASPSPSLQLQQNQHQQHHQHQQVQQQLPQQQQYQQQHQQQQQLQHPHQHHHHQQQTLHQHQEQQQQQQQHQQQQQTHQHNTMNNHLQQHHPHQIQHHHHQTLCSPPNSSGNVDPIDDALSCGLMNSGRVVAASTQTHHSGSIVNGCEQVVAPTSMSLGTTTVNVPGGPPLMYTVHRVVTTAQIQTAGGNTFAASSSVSSVVSAVRNEADCMANSVAAAGAGTTTLNAALNNGCLVSGAGGGGAGAGGAGMVGDIAGAASGDNNILNNNGGGLGSSPGLSTNYLSHQQKCNSNAADAAQSAASRIASSNYNTTTSSTNTSYISGAKTSSASISRPLQNVIPTCVYLMSRVAVHMEIEGTAQCPTQVMLAAALGCEELGIANKLLAQSIFGLWMTSALLEIQLKSHHRPYAVRVAWPNLLEKFSHGNPIQKKYDEPMIMLKRNVFFSKRDEEKIKDHRILELLYEEAKYNVLSGRYVMEPVHSLMLGGIQARIELGPYNSNIHTISFFRENQSRFLPQHVAKSSSWSWLPVSRKTSAEVKLLEQFKRVPQTATTRKLMRKYLEFCWALPFYGAAFFHGQVEQPVCGLMSLVNHKDVEVIIAINERGVFVIDPVECTLLLGLRYEDLSWDFAKPSANDDPECLTCIFIQFDAVENGIQISKLMQIFSKQAAMIDALISHFAEQMRKRKQEGNASEQFHDEPNPIQNNGNGVLCNKLSRLTLATFDEEGRCIGQMGSLSISY